MRRLFSYRATVAFFVVAMIMASSPVSAGLCTTCAGKMFVMNIGKCVNCAAATTSGSFTLCPACSALHNECEACRGSLSVAPTIVTPVALPAVAPAKTTKRVAQPAAKVVPVVAPAKKTKPVVLPATEVEPVAAPATEAKPASPPAVVAPTAPAGK